MKHQSMYDFMYLRDLLLILFREINTIFSILLMMMFFCVGAFGTEDSDAIKKEIGLSDEEIFDWEKFDIEFEQALAEAKTAYEDAKANEQSLANRTLTAASIAATGVGGMELAMGLAEQKAAKAADQDMTAYIESFRCTYGKDKSVKAGPDEIELPGGNDANMIKYRNEYMTLAADLKVRKEALEMKPGIESEEILDKSQMGLYDQENTGIESGAYASLYRAKALNSEEDQAKLDEEAKKAKARVIGGATAAGVGVVGGAIGNGLINGDLGKGIGKNGTIEDFKNMLKSKGLTNIDGIDFSKLDKNEILQIKKNLNSLGNVNGKDANEIINEVRKR